MELIQEQSMKIHYPEFTKYRNSEGNLVFRGYLQPKEEMPRYEVSIEYRQDSMPRVYVLNPVLKEDAPHTYRSLGGCLCLYKPSNFSWTADKPISNYIVRWTACWLYFYEVWKDLGVWYGPEASHENNKSKEA